MLKRLEAVKSELRADKSRGFSLVELIIVVAILAILVAIAIPIFGNIQEQAALSAAKANASNGAASVAAAVAQDPGITVEEVEALLDTMGNDLVLVSPTAGTVSLDNYCVSVDGADEEVETGPGC